MKAKKIKLILIEDAPEYRHVINYALEDKSELELISQFASAEQVLHSLKTPSKWIQPDVILLDLNLPGISGLQALPELIKQMPESKIIILTQSEREDDILLAIKQGAAGYLLKSATINEIISGIQNTMAGGTALDPQMAKYILNSFKDADELSHDRSVLTAREIEILTFIAQGDARKEISDSLKISIKTVDNHIAHIFDKLNVVNAPAAVAKGFKIGILRLK